MWANRTKLLRGVVVFLVGCAVLGFIMGVKGALPRGGATSVDSGPPAASTDAVVIEAAPLEEAVEIPPAETEEDDAEADEEKAKEPEKKAAPAEQPKAEPAPPPPAPKEEPPPADPVGDLIPAPPPDAVLY